MKPKTPARKAKPESCSVKAARQKTATARDLMAGVFERINDGFVAFDADMNYTFVNEGAAQIFRGDGRNADL